MYKVRPEIFITFSVPSVHGKGPPQSEVLQSSSSNFFLAVTMADQTERRRQHELVLRENIIAQQVVMMIGRDFPEDFECRRKIIKI